MRVLGFEIKKKKSYSPSPKARQDALYRAALKQARQEHVETRKEIIKEMNELRSEQQVSGLKGTLSLVRAVKDVQAELVGDGNGNGNPSWINDAIKLAAVVLPPLIMNGNGSAAALANPHHSNGNGNGNGNGKPKLSHAGVTSRPPAPPTPAADPQSVSDLTAVVAGYQFVLIDAAMNGEDMRLYAQLLKSKVEVHPELEEYLKVLVSMPIEAILTQFAKINPDIMSSNTAKGKLTELLDYVREDLGEAEQVEAL
jgi:hypothetical protein